MSFGHDRIGSQSPRALLVTSPCAAWIGPTRVIAASIGRIAPRRRHQRDVIVACRLGDTDAYRHDIEKWRARQVDTMRSEIISNVEKQLVSSDPQRSIGE